MLPAPTILLADDEFSFRESTAELLREDGYRCDVSEDAHSALRFLCAGNYDLVIADIHMPGNRSLELVERVKEASPGTPVILVTGYPSMETAISSIHLPVAAYMTKPLQHDAFFQHVRTAIAESRYSRTLTRVKNTLRQCLEELDQIPPRQQNHLGENGARGDRVPHTTLRALAGCVAELVELEVQADPAANISRTCELLACPRLPRQRNVLRKAVQLLNETKRRFKSKELAQVRGMLDDLLKDSESS